MKKLLLASTAVLALTVAYGQTKQASKSKEIKEEKTKVVYIGCANAGDTLQITNAFKYNTAEKIEAKLKTLKNTEKILYSNFSNYIQIVTKGQYTELKIVGAQGWGGTNGNYIKPYTIHDFDITPYPNKRVKVYIYEVISDDKKILIDSCIFQTQKYPVEINIGGKKPNTTITKNELLHADSTILITCNTPSLQLYGFEMNFYLNGNDGGASTNENHLSDKMKKLLDSKLNVLYIEFIRFKFPDGCIRKANDFTYKVKL
ncbi:MAG: hypothetical protein HY063_11830 [Bacteroidetes bacterium]|nr:hypothetical protein [Bacteroidota bacterium]